MPEAIFVCPLGYSEKHEAQAAVKKQLHKAKYEGAAFVGWDKLHVYFCHECRRYHIWPRRKQKLAALAAQKPANPLQPIGLV